MKLRDWAEQQGIKYETACRWFREGALPHRTEKIKGTLLIYPPEPPKLCPRCGWSSEDKV